MCNPPADLEIGGDGKWKNKRTKTFPSVFHFNGGGKTQHLEMESKMWYKTKEENSPEKINKLAASKINVPTQPGGVLPFKDLCPNYRLFQFAV